VIHLAPFIVNRILLAASPKVGLPLETEGWGEDFFIFQALLGVIRR
jgi:hypothetical protein